MTDSIPGISKIENPEDYFKGVSANENSFPRKVNIFKKETARALEEDTIHYHYRYNLIFNIKGAATISLEQQVFTLNPGQCLILHPWQNHYYRMLQENDIQWLFFGFELSDEKNLAGTRGKIYNFGAWENQLITWLISKELKSSDDKSKPTSLLCSTLDILLYSICSKKGLQPKHNLQENPAMDLVASVQQWIYYNLHLSFTIRDIAEKIDVSESHLRNVFRNTIGVSLGQYIRKARIRNACSRIDTENTPISQIANLCGFESAFSFSRSFKKVMGVSPREYLKKSRKR